MINACVQYVYNRHKNLFCKIFKPTACVFNQTFIFLGVEWDDCSRESNRVETSKENNCKCK